MSGAKVMIDMRAAKGFSPSQSNEHLRRLDDCERAQKATWNYDPTREHLNFEIGKGGVVLDVNKSKSINTRIQENLDSRGIVNPNKKLIDGGLAPKYRIVANFILGGNREVMRNLAFGDQTVDWEHGADNSMIVRNSQIEAWAKDAYRFMCKKYGEKNIAAFVVHLDEANPHVHCTVLPINERGKFSFIGTFMDGKDRRDAFSKHMTNLHTEFAKEVGEKYGMERGDSIEKTGAEHRTTEQYREWLWKEAQKKEEEVTESNKAIEDNKETIQTQRKEIKHAAARLKGLQTMIKNLETHKADLELEIKRLRQDLENGKISKEEADKKLARINVEIERTKEKIADKFKKLKIAQGQLDAIENKKADVETKYNEVKEKLDKETPVLNKKILHEMQSLGYHMAALDTHDRLDSYNKMKSQLSQGQRDFLDRTVGNIWDNSLIGQIAENTSSICSVATALFMGYIDSAMTIAESHGGGGGPGSGWGKKDDEDDLAFRRRCFGMALQMMRTGKSQRRKR